MTTESLYIHRPLLNSGFIRDWAKEQGFSSTLHPDDMHVTQAFSRNPVNWGDIPDTSDNVIVSGGPRSVDRLGDAAVLRFQSPELHDRWKTLTQDHGASWDWPNFQPHVTISYSGAPKDLKAVRPYTGPLEFGPEQFRPIDEDWQGGVQEEVVKEEPSVEDVHVPGVEWKIPGRRKKKVKPIMPIQEGVATYAKVVKIDESLGLVLGWAIMSKVNGEPYFDLQGDHIPEAVMLRAATEFMQHSRVAKEMHDGDDRGAIVFAWPMTGEIAKAMGIETNQTGLMIGYKPDDSEVLAKYRNGEYTGFSVGGQGIREELP